MSYFAPLFCALALSSCATAPHPTASIHSNAPPLFDFDDIGHTTFPITTNSPAAQRYFEQGVSLLHDFWYYEALRSFRHAAALDSTCAMAWWGIYQTPRGGRALKREAIRKARHYAAQGADPRNALYTRDNGTGFAWS
ncbi:MAG: hypothetical protein ACKVJG_06170 [Candidatus Latescibacterota bacterium]|jgi:hypothetical protein